jgi:hypothetical protein
MQKPLPTLILTTCVGLALTCATGAFAQMNTPAISPTVAPDMTPNMQSDTNRDTSSTGVSGASMTPGTTSSAYSDTGTNSNTGATTSTSFVLGSKIMGTQVKNQQNESLGTISNLVINPETGHIRYAVISTGGKKVTVPWNALQAAPHATSGTAPHFTINTTKEKLAQAPKFDANNLSNLSNRAAEEPIFTYYDIVWFPDVLSSDEQNARKGGSTAGSMGMSGTSAEPSTTPSEGATMTPMSSVSPMMSPSPSPR